MVAAMYTEGKLHVTVLPAEVQNAWSPGKRRCRRLDDAVKVITSTRKQVKVVDQSFCVHSHDAMHLSTYLSVAVHAARARDVVISHENRCLRIPKQPRHQDVYIVQPVPFESPEETRRV
jgi:hypothetical protein